MLAIPSLELRAGQSAEVPAGPGSPGSPDAARIARDWVRDGFSRLHVVDVDAATGTGRNASVVRELLADSAVPVQVGGGVRDEEQIAALLDDGASWVVVGTRAVEDDVWLADMASLFPGQLLVAADVRGRRVLSRGRTRTLPHDVVSLVEEIRMLPLAGVLITLVDAERKLESRDLTLLEDIVEASGCPVFASGCVYSAEDLRALEHRGVHGALLGDVFDANVIDVRRIIEEFGA